MPAVVAGGETAESLIEAGKEMAKKVAKVGATADELSGNKEGEFVAGTAISSNEAVMSEQAITSITERPVFADATYLSAKELVEKYGRNLIYEYLFNAGEEKENLDQKTDRQLANILKKKVGEA